MHEPERVVVGPSLGRLFLSQFVGGCGIVAGLFLIIGPGTILAVASLVVVGLASLFLAGGIFGQRPRLELSHDGFVIRALTGVKFRRWSDVEGPFEVLKLGWTRAVGYKLTEECRTRLRKRAGTLPGGYDDAVGGALQLPAEELAALLNEHQRRSQGDV